MTGTLDARVPMAERETFAAIADVLIPAHGALPAASEVGVHRGGLDKVINARPDFLEPLRAAMDLASGQPAKDAAERLFADHPELFQAVSLAASGAYYMAPEVRAQIGYPGQESLSYDTAAEPHYVTGGALDRVRARGPVYRPTPTPD